MMLKPVCISYLDDKILIITYENSPFLKVINHSHKVRARVPLVGTHQSQYPTIQKPPTKLLEPHRRLDVFISFLEPLSGPVRASTHQKIHLCYLEGCARYSPGQAFYIYLSVNLPLLRHYPGRVALLPSLKRCRLRRSG